ncbi:MAG TPA: MFS transporter [Anaerolineae bacterium]|nr:MFS transporter [Anaerolineae bacterium]
MTANSSNKLTLKTKLAYGIGDLGASIVAAVNGFFLNAFLLEVAGLRPLAAGAIFLLVKIWDSINDPIIGALTDRTNTRWGRRRPWLLFGAIPFGVAFLLHWYVPDISPNGKFVYYLVIAILLDTAFTAVNVPYTALTPELTRDYNERTILNAYRFGFSIIGGMIAAALHLPLVSQFDSPVMGNVIVASIWAVFITTSSLITFAFTEESQFSDTQENELGFFDGMRIALSNVPFLYVTSIYLLSWLCIQFVQANIYLYWRYWVGGTDAGFTPVLLGVQLSAFFFVIIWGQVSQQIGKQKVYYIGMSIWIVVCIAIFFVQPGQFTLVYILAGLAGIGVSIGYLIPWSMLPDVIELDELETGQRREGIFYGFFVFLQKLGISLGLAFSNIALDFAGYINPDEIGVIVDQPDNVSFVLRLFVSLVPAVILALSIPVVYNYPITQERHQEIQAQLENRSNK